MTSVLLSTIEMDLKTAAKQDSQLCIRFQAHQNKHEHCVARAKQDTSWANTCSSEVERKYKIDKPNLTAKT